MSKSIHKENDLISVIIPTYNRSDLLQRAIKSILKQTYHNFELIIVDDGSTDINIEVIKAFSDSRIKYIKFQKNRGQPAAINEGIRVSKGNYITFLDDDDEIFPKMLELEVNVLKDTEEECGFVVGLGIKLNGNGYSIFNERKYQKRNELLKAQLSFCAISLSGVLIKRKCFDKVGLFDERLILGNDWDVMLRLIKKYEFKYIERILYKAHYDDASNNTHITEDSTRITKRRLKTYSILLKKNYQDLKYHKAIKAKFYFRIAQILFHNKKSIQCKLFFNRAFQNKPLNIRYLFRSLSSRYKNAFFIFYLVEKFIFQKFQQKFLPDNEI